MTAMEDINLLQWTSQIPILTFTFPTLGRHGLEYRRNNIVIHRVFTLCNLCADEDIMLGWE